MESWPRGPCGLFRFCVRPPGFRCFNLNVAPVRICSRCLGLARWRTLPVLSSARLHPDTSPRALRSAFESMRRDGLKIITYTTGEAVEPRLVSVIQAHIRYTLTHFFFSRLYRLGASAAFSLEGQGDPRTPRSSITSLARRTQRLFESLGRLSSRLSAWNGSSSRSNPGSRLR